MFTHVYVLKHVCMYHMYKFIFMHSLLSVYVTALRMYKFLVLEQIDSNRAFGACQCFVDECGHQSS